MINLPYPYFLDINEDNYIILKEATYQFGPKKGESYRVFHSYHSNIESLYKALVKINTLGPLLQLEEIVNEIKRVELFLKEEAEKKGKQLVIQVLESLANSISIHSDSTSEFSKGVNEAKLEIKNKIKDQIKIYKK